MKRLLASVLFALPLGATHAATFTVTNLNDSGPGSLRDAVARANVSSPPNAINVSVPGTIVLTSGRIVISAGPLTISGPGAGSLAIDGNANDQIFTIPEPVYAVCPALSTGSDFLVTISGLTLRNASGTKKYQGGAIFSEKSLSLRDVTFQHNSGDSGGGVNFKATHSGQALTIANSQFVGNVARPLSTNLGSETNAVGGALNIGGDCVANQGGSANVTIANSLFSGNRAQPVNLWGQGGAIMMYANADVTITDTRIVGNSVDPPDPPVTGARYRGGAIRGLARSLTIERSEISDNVADVGGAIGVHTDLVDRQTPATAMVFKLINSTISGNIAATTGGAMTVNSNVALEIDNSTISDNVAAPTRTGGIAISSGETYPPSGSNAAVPTVTIVSSILANNTGDNGDVATDLATVPSFTINATRSLIEKMCPSPTCEISVAGTNYRLGLDPMLGPLAFNGGATRTHALLPGSPAINTGNNPLNLTTDQRGAGFARVVSGTADMGAFEYDPANAGNTYSRDYVQKAYVAYYGRPADPGGLTYWALRMDAEGGSLNAIINAFGYSDEFNRRYGGLSYTQLVAKIYQQTLGRDPDPAGLIYYVGELQAGRRTLQSITLDVLNGATAPPDSTVVANKLDVAAYYTAKVAAGCPYGMEQDGVITLASLTSNVATVAAAKAGIDAWCGPGTYPLAPPGPVVWPVHHRHPQGLP